MSRVLRDESADHWHCTPVAVAPRVKDNVEVRVFPWKANSLNLSDIEDKAVCKKFNFTRESFLSFSTIFVVRKNNNLIYIIRFAT